MSVNKVQALQKVYYSLSGSQSKGNTISEVLQDIYKYLASASSAPSANVTKLIDAIAGSADSLIIPTGKKTVTENGEDIDIAQYATLDVNVSGGSGNEITFAEVTMNLTTELGTTIPILYLTNLQLPGLEIGDEAFKCEWAVAENGKVTIPMYDGQGYFEGAGGYDDNSSTTYVSSAAFTLSGDIEDAQSGGYIVTGDCTITGHLSVVLV